MVASKTSMSPRTQVIRQVLTEVLVPIVAKEGGEIHLLCVNDNEFTIHMGGRYSGSPAAVLFYEELALPLIEKVAKGTVVNWSTGRLVPPNAEKLELPIAKSEDDTSAATDQRR